MIARIWKGAVRPQDGDAYAGYMQTTGIPAYATTPGNRGVWMLRRNIEEKTEFLMFTLWDSLDSVKAFAGQDHETAVFYPEDERFLIERDPASTHYLVDTHVSPPLEQQSVADPAQVVRNHIVAFNAQDLDRLLACFSADATWATGSDHFSGTGELAQLFANTFSDLGAELSVITMVVAGDQVACELSEHLKIDGIERVDKIAGFYRVQSGRITAAKIYREGFADV